MSGRRRQEAFEKWKVLISTTLIQSIVCGVIESFGALFVPMMKAIFTNDGSKTVKAALIGSLASGILMGFSPMSSWLCGRFGPQIVAVMGGVIIFFATFTASFSQSFVTMALTYGVLLGIGCSLIFISNSIILSQHFGEDCTVAFGLLGFGNGVVNSIMPHILTFAVDSIGLYGAIRTVSLMLAPIMFIPFYWKELDFEGDKTINTTSLESDLSAIRRKAAVSGDGGPPRRSNKNQANKMSRRAIKKQRRHDSNFNNTHMWDSDNNEEDMVVFKIANDSNKQSVESKLKELHGSVSSDFDFDFMSPTPSSENLVNAFELGKHFDTFKNKGFLNLCLSMIVASLGYQVPNVHIVNYSSDLSVAGNPQILLTCLGAASALGPLINPLFVDKFEEHISKFRIFQIFVLGYGISVMFVPLVNNFNILMFTCCLIGYFDGSLSTLIGPLTIDLVGTEKAGNALGIYYGSIALSVTIAAPLAGFIFEVGQNYRASFFVAGLFFMSGGFMLSFTHKNFKFQEPTNVFPIGGTKTN